jgi:hypothetical protein
LHLHEVVKAAHFVDKGSGGALAEVVRVAQDGMAVQLQQLLRRHALDSAVPAAQA